MTVNFHSVKLKVNYRKLSKMTGDHAASLFEIAAKELIQYYDGYVPREEGILVNTKDYYRLAGTEENVTTVVAAYGHKGGRSTYAIPQHLGAPDGNPLMWGHIMDLEYTTEGTDKEYLIQGFEERTIDYAMELLQTQLVAGFKG